MQWSRVKSIFLVILLLVDGFLAFNIAGKYLSRSYRQAENAYNIVEILSGRGIRVESLAIIDAMDDSSGAITFRH